VFPATPAEFEAVSIAYYRRLGALCATVAEILARRTRSAAAALRAAHRQALRLPALRVLPALTEPALPGQLRAGSHSNYGTFTLVNFDDAPVGLQVLTRDGEWLDVPVVGDSFVCNIGDLFEVWTNDRWVPTKHRVAIPADERWEDSERLSLVYFHEPNYDVVAEALPTCVSADNPAKYEPLTAGEHNRRKVMRQVTLETAEA
jgi:isopenicillin N synthase-like dioxygenase